MSIAKRNAIQNIQRLIPDEILRDQLIDLHLGKLSEDQIREIREEREREAELILAMFPKEQSHHITNGEAEVSRSGNSGDKNDLSINEVK